MSRGSHTSLSYSLTLALCALSTELSAQTYDGSWRVTRDSVSVTLSEWGEACGPRPSSHDGRVGREVAVRTEGSQLALSGAYTWRTDRCLSDNRDVAVLSASATPGRWTVSCATGTSIALGERGSSTLSASDANHLRLRNETTYAWSIRGSNCRAVSTLEREFERLGAAPPVPPPPPPPPPPPVPPVRPVNRCATPGAPSAMVLSPARVRTTPGRSTCFRARVLDSNRCEVPGQSITWSSRRLGGEGDGSIDRGCFLPSSNATGADFEVTAISGLFTSRAVLSVVSTDRYRDLIAAHLEDPDAGSVIPTAPSGTSLGGAPVGAQSPVSSAPRAWLPWILLGGGVLLGFLAILLLVTRRARSVDDPDPAHAPLPPESDPEVMRPSPSGRPRHNVSVPILPEEADNGPPEGSPDAGSSSIVVAPDATSPNILKPLVSSPFAATAMMPAVGDLSALQPAPIAPIAPTAPIAPIAPIAPTAPVAPVMPVMPPVSPRALAQVPARPPKRCSTCGELIHGALSYCPNDGSRLPEASAADVPEVSRSALSAMVCPLCGTRSTDGSRFCSNDGTVLIAASAPATAPSASLPQPEGVCPVCHRAYPSPTTFCGEDGTKLLR